jgi:hypothetical protein
MNFSYLVNFGGAARPETIRTGIISGYPPADFLREMPGKCAGMRPGMLLKRPGNAPGGGGQQKFWRIDKKVSNFSRLWYFCPTHN